MSEATTVPGARMDLLIDADTTSTGNGSYDSVRVVPGAALTLLPGARVRFGWRGRLRVEGRLVAVGSATAPIVFTGATAQPGWWTDHGAGADGCRARAGKAGTRDRRTRRRKAGT
jgi:hypothetical protein